MRYLMYAAALVACCSQAAEVTLTVTEAIGGRSKSAVKMVALSQVKEKAAEQLPTVIVGVERSITRNEESEYTQIIKGLDSAALKIDVLEDDYNEASGEYRMTAKVTLDEKMSLSLLQDIQDGQQAMHKLKNAYAALDDKVTKAIATSTAATAANWQIELPANLSRDWFARDTEEASYKAKSEYALSMLALLYAKYQDAYLKAVKLEVTSARSVTVTLPLDWYRTAFSPLNTELSNKLGVEYHWTEYAKYAEPCLVEYKKNPDGQLSILEKRPLRRYEKFDQYYSKGTNSSPYEIKDGLTGTAEEMIRGELSLNESAASYRNLKADPRFVKVKFCYGDAHFYQKVQEAKSTIVGLSNK